MCTIHSNVCWVEEDIIIASWLYTCTSFLPRHGFPAAFFVHHWAALRTKSINRWAFLSKYIILWGDVWIILKYLEMLNICTIYHCCCNLFRNSLLIFFPLKICLYIVMNIFIYVTMTIYSFDLFTFVFRNFNTSRNEIHVLTIFLLILFFYIFLKGKHR